MAASRNRLNKRLPPRRETYRYRLPRLEQLENRCLLSGAGQVDYDHVSPDWFATPATNVVKMAFVSPISESAPSTRWIVRLSEEATEKIQGVGDAKSVLNQGGGSFDVLRGLGLPGLVLVTTTLDQADVEARLRASPDVTSFEQDLAVSGQATATDDPDFARQWGLDKPNSVTQASAADINAPEAWKVATGGRSVVVAVVDSGIDLSHEDLYTNIWVNQGEIPAALRAQLQDVDNDGLITFNDLNARGGYGSDSRYVNQSHVSDLNNNGRIDADDLLGDYRWADGYDNDGNGFTDDLFGWDFCNNDRNPTDDLGHGTHIAGTIGAVSNNGVGVAGVNWATSMMALKFLDSHNEGSLSNAIRAINYATMMRGQHEATMMGSQQGANVRVINGSWGQWGAGSAGLQAAIEAAGAADVLYVAASGNGNLLGQGLDNDVNPFYPASFPLDNIIAVAASSPQGQLAEFSNYGVNSVDIAAPGAGIWSTLPGDKYGSMNGTSMAAAFVSGVAALVTARFSGRPTTEVRNAIIEGAAQGVSELSGHVQGGRRLDACGAITSGVFAPQVVGHISAPNVTVASAAPAEVQVTYTDVPILDRSTLDGSDLEVTRQGISSKPPSVTLESVNPPIHWGLVEGDTIVCGDFNGDGRDDFAGLDNATGKWYVARSEQATTAGEQDRFVTEDWGTGPSTAWQYVLVGDFNGDGSDDIVWLQDVGAQRQCWVARSQAGRFVFEQWDTWGTEALVSVQVGNFDGVRGDDIALLRKINGVGEWWVGVSGQLGGQWQFDHGTSRWGWWGATDLTAVRAGDFDFDGRDDLACLVTDTGQWWVSRSQGDHFDATWWGSSDASAQWAAIVTGDFNGDGRTDVAGLQKIDERGFKGRWWVGLSAYDETLDKWGFDFSTWDWWGSVDLDAVRVGDFNGDHLDDILGVVAPDGSWWVSQSSGDRFTPKFWGGSGVTEWTTIEAGDFNGDGRDDAAGLLKLDGPSWKAGQWWVQSSTGASFRAERWLDSASCTATYHVAAVGGEWDALDYGTYQVALRADEVGSMPGVVAQPRVLGTFQVKIPDHAVFYVDSTADAVDAHIGDGIAADAQGRCTLRAAIQEANAAGNDLRTIFLDSGTYSFGIAGTDEDLAAAGDLDITGNVRIVGVGKTTIDATGLGRVFDVTGTLRLEGVTITGGKLTGSGQGGAGFRNRGSLTVLDATISANAADGRGGGVFNADAGTLTLTRCTIADNSALQGGGVCHEGTNAVTITDTTFSANIAALEGGALANTGSGGIDLANTTIAGNIARGGRGGGIAAVGSGPLTLVHCTIIENQGNPSAGGVAILDAHAEVRVKNTLIAGNREATLGDPSDLYGQFLSQGYNLVPESGYGFSWDNWLLLHDQIRSDAISFVEPLADNGGPVWTCALLPGSTAIDAGDPSEASGHDARGELRPTDGDGDGSAVPDIGAFEAFYGEIHGVCYHDLNGNRTQDDDEPGLAGITIELRGDPDHDGHEELLATTVTAGDDPATVRVNEAGAYAFTDVPPGDYRLTTVLSHNWTTTIAGLDGIRRVNVPAAGGEATYASWATGLSDDARYAVFTSFAWNLISGDTNNRADVFVVDQQRGTLERANVRSDGNQEWIDAPGMYDVAQSGNGQISDDGRYVVFQSNAPNLVDGDTNLKADIFVFDRTTRSVKRVNLAADTQDQANDDACFPTISGNGRYVAFMSTATNLVPGADSGLGQIYICEWQTGAIHLVSAGPDSLPGDGWSATLALSKDGLRVAFTSQSTNLVADDTIGGTQDVFVADWQTGSMRRIAGSVDGVSDCQWPWISGNGRFVAFQSVADNFVADDTNATMDIFVYDCDLGTIERVSVAAGGAQGNATSAHASLSYDGRFVAFASDASNLVPGDTNHVADVFVVDRVSHAIERVSVNAQGVQGDAYSQSTSYWMGTPRLSADGRYVVFQSLAGNLVAHDNNRVMDVFVAPTSAAALYADCAVRLAAGESAQGIDFGVRAATGTISGRVFNDVNRNARKDREEVGLAGVTVYVDLDNDGQLDDTEPRTTTDALGDYALFGLTPFTTYTVAHLPGDGWQQTFPGLETAGTYSVYVGTHQSVVDRDFGDFRDPTTGQAASATIEGRCYQDRNADGKYQPGEQVIAGLVVYLDLNNDGHLDDGEPRQLTSATGEYSFTGLGVRSYTVRVVQPDAWIPTGPSQSHTLASGSADEYPLQVLENPQAVAVADFNGDLIPDLAIANGGASVNAAGQNTVSIWLGRGDGTFPKEPDKSVSVPYGPRSLVAGDFDGDGDTDLATADSESSLITILNNDGHGTFSVALSTGAGVLPAALTAADLDGDTHLDLVVAHFRGDNNGTLWVFWGNAGGGFTEPQEVRVGLAPCSIAAGDFIPGGCLDLAVANYDAGTVMVLEVLSGRQFSLRATIPCPFPSALTAADLDGDGDVDLAVADYQSGNVYVLRNDLPAGTFSPQGSYYAETGVTSLAHADLDLDGHIDLVAAKGMSKQPVWLRNRGDGSFQVRDFLGVACWPEEELASVAVGDFDTNGSPDLAVTYAGQHLFRVLMNSAAAGAYEVPIVSGTETVGGNNFSFRTLNQTPTTLGLFEPAASGFSLWTANTSGPADYSFGYGQPDAGWKVLVGDWNGDRGDGVGLYDPHASTFYLTNSLASGFAEFTFGYGEPGAGWIPLVGDWDGNGSMGVGLYDPKSSTFYLTNTLSTGYAEYTFGYGEPKAGWIPIVGDWDGNGSSGVGLYDPHTSTFYLTNTLSAGYAEHTFGYGEPNAGWQPMVGDWNGDKAAGLGLYDPHGSWFYLTNAFVSGYAQYTFGYGEPNAGWKPLVGDWDGNATTGVGLYDPTGTTFYLTNAMETGVAEYTAAFGQTGHSYEPIVGCWTPKDSTATLSVQPAANGPQPEATVVDQLDLADLAGRELSSRFDEDDASAYSEDGADWLAGLDVALGELGDRTV
jgi:CSLREA domain-containing protein